MDATGVVIKQFMKATNHIILCGISQVVIVVIGVLLTARCHKAMRALMGESGWYAEHTVFSVWVRDFGFTLLVIPILVTLMALFYESTNEARSSRLRTIGLMTTGALVVVMFASVFLCFRTPLLIPISR